ncbi:cobalamin biosynthesis protein CbiD [Herbaspirillum sp. LeCh32-8]|uniref:cobalt-precorrin-5B (C(1))-methyltransferase CbiD n=1 Tax=Herbaspirillum sp. LeCh32-8 TaxID=2821356 RepID=UPI001AE51260|nr:cobalt-precorrin-5B (C(1))-methyltransferase CbiD [Herbaspirillum sp. LeCh32-8]MBP0599429.1 cobalamin biosynthesis protein CbiD [Herbaspirillum sp. LeCh32-8]
MEAAGEHERDGERAELRRAEYDLSVLAPNGLRRGRSTGSCATAAVRAALYCLLGGIRLERTEVSLPDGAHFISVPIKDVALLDDASAQAEVLKDGGDDPDNTHGATIFAQVRRNGSGEIRFFAGEGVGTATMPGLRVAVGEPAINPVPRAMMRAAVAEVLAELQAPQRNGDAGWREQGFDLTIGCREGQAIAPKTFNPKLGIVGGISILGTSGIVEPMSMASWIASIEVYIRVALADCRTGDVVAYLPGKIGRSFAAQELGLPDKRSVQIANFLGDALDFTQQALAEDGRRLPVLWLAGHPGKLAKVLDGVWDTHSSKSNMAMQGVARVAQEMHTMNRQHCGAFDAGLLQQMKEANTVEAVIELVRARDESLSRVLWTEIEARIAALAAARVPNVSRVAVRLFDLDGRQLGAGA